MSYSINHSFPGGNVLVENIEGLTIYLRPDLRGGRDWFYWYFEIFVTESGPVRFVLPELVEGHSTGAVGPQGPAISKDGGRSWKWLGAASVERNAFVYNFESGESVRFSSTIPYLQAEFDDFLRRHRTSPYLECRVLGKSRKGRDVELVRIGDDSAEPILVTGRQHANESIASYVMEGFLEGALAEDATGRAFRSRYSIHAIPFVDKDGVEEGDQGKNRMPHDHNRDWSDAPIYPEISALERLIEEKGFRFFIDFHCPTLTMAEHQCFYIGGIIAPPAHNLENLTEFARRMEKALPDTAPDGPVLRARQVSNPPEPKHSHYCGFRKGSVVVCTMEVPFAPPDTDMEVEALRIYGRAMLKAWTESEFRSSNQ